MKRKPDLPEKLRGWADTFYSNSKEMTDSGLPVIPGLMDCVSALNAAANRIEDLEAREKRRRKRARRTK